MATEPPARPAFGQSSSGHHGRVGADAWPLTEAPSRRHTTVEEEHGQTPAKRDEFGVEPAYQRVLGLTAGWFAIPALFYVVWLVTLDGDRQGLAGRQVVASLPWLFVAVVLSLAVAGLLRWAIVGWRALTISFAAAVIGSGMTTIVHSLTL